MTTARELDEILAPSYLDGVGQLPTDELRRRRAACEQVEEGVSYVRRIVQGRLDLVRAEAQRRTESAESGDRDAGTLVGQLGRILGGDAVSGGQFHSRSTRLRFPPAAVLFEERLASLPDESELTDLSGCSHDELQMLADRLASQERDLSAIRRQMFDRIDGLRDELADRYKDGRANVGDFLDGS